MQSISLKNVSQFSRYYDDKWQLEAPYSILKASCEDKTNATPYLLCYYLSFLMPIYTYTLA